MMTFLLAVLPGAALFCLAMAVYFGFFAERDRAREHVRASLSVLEKPVTTQFLPMIDHGKLLKPTESDPRFARWALLLERANWSLRPKDFFLLCLFSGVGGMAVVWLFGNPFIIALLSGILAGMLPRLWLEVRIWLRMKKAAEQFPNVLDMLINCFKTGYGLSRALQVVADNCADPWGTEFGKMSVELQLGASLEDALAQLKKRVPSMDVELFASALLIQKETGGNLAEILANLSRTIRERFKLFRRVKAISAQGKLSATIVSCIPFGLMGIIYLFLPEPVIAFVQNPIGILLIAVSGVWMLAGIGVLYKIVQVEV